MAIEGKLGKVVIFNPPKPAPPGLLRKGEDACKAILRTQSVKELSPELFTKYFHQFYSAVNDFDKPKFEELLVRESTDFNFQFRTLAKEFNLIEDAQRSIVVLYKNNKTGNNSEKWINELRFHGPSKLLSRKLQRFIVNVPLHLFNRIQQNNYVTEVSGYYVQNDPILYKPGLGLLGNESDWIIGNGVV